MLMVLISDDSDYIVTLGDAASSYLYVQETLKNMADNVASPPHVGLNIFDVRAFQKLDLY